MRRIVWLTFLVLATLAGLLLLWQFREAIILFILSLGIAAAARPLADRIGGWRLPRGVGLIIVYLITVGGIVGVLAFFSDELFTEVERVSNGFVMIYDSIWKTWPQGTGLEKSIVQYLPAPTQLYQAIAGEQGTAMLRSFLGATLSSLTVISQFVAVLVLSIYWSFDQVHFERLWISLLPPEQRIQARAIWRDIETGVGAYIRSEIIQSILASILLGIGYAVMGLKYPLLMALFGAVAWLIPWLGAVLAIVPVAVVGMQAGLVPAVGGVLFTAVVLLLLEVVVEPRLSSRRQYSSLLTLVFMIALADVYGLIGLVIAPPLAAAVQIFYSRLVTTSITEPARDIHQGIQDLGERLEKAQAAAAERGEELTPQTLSLVERLEKLIDRAGQETSG